MIWLRKGIVHLMAVLLFVTLLGGVGALSFNRTLGEPQQLEKLLEESGLYDHAVTGALDHSQDEASKRGSSDSSVSLQDAIVQQAAQQAFPPELLKQSANSFIEANYAWLKGKTPTPEFSIDLTGAKQDFASLVGQYVENRLAGLPVCTNEQLAQLQIPVSSLSVTCRPASLDPETEGARVAQEIRASDFLTKPVITASSLGRDNPSQGKPYYEHLSEAPQLYSLIQKLPLICAGLALLLALAIIFIAPSRRKGWRRVGVVLFVAGGLLIATVFLTDMVVDKITDRLNDTVTAQLQQPRNDFLHHTASELSQTKLWFGIAFVILAVIIFIMLFKSRQHSGQSKNQLKAPDNTSHFAEADTSEAIPSTPQPSPRRQPPTMDIMGPQPKSGQPKPPIQPSAAPPKLKKPPRPRGPRLIQ